MELKLSQEFLTENDCYQAGRKIVPKGIMVHSTGVAQPDPLGKKRQRQQYPHLL